MGFSLSKAIAGGAGAVKDIAVDYAKMNRREEIMAERDARLDQYARNRATENREFEATRYEGRRDETRAYAERQGGANRDMAAEALKIKNQREDRLRANKWLREDNIRDEKAPKTINQKQTDPDTGVETTVTLERQPDGTYQEITMSGSGVPQPNEVGRTYEDAARQAEKEVRDEMGLSDWIPFNEPSQQAVRKRADEIYKTWRGGAQKPGIISSAQKAPSAQPGKAQRNVGDSFVVKGKTFRWTEKGPVPVPDQEVSVGQPQKLSTAKPKDVLADYKVPGRKSALVKLLEPGKALGGYVYERGQRKEKERDKLRGEAVKVVRSYLDGSLLGEKTLPPFTENLKGMNLIELALESGELTDEESKVLTAWLESK